MRCQAVAEGSEAGGTACPSSCGSSRGLVRSADPPAPAMHSSVHAFFGGRAWKPRPPHRRLHKPLFMQPPRRSFITLLGTEPRTQEEIYELMAGAPFVNNQSTANVWYTLEVGAPASALGCFLCVLSGRSSGCRPRCRALRSGLAGPAAPGARRRAPPRKGAPEAPRACCPLTAAQDLNEGTWLFHFWLYCECPAPRPARNCTPTFGPAKPAP